MATLATLKFTDAKKPKAASPARGVDTSYPPSSLSSSRSHRHRPRDAPIKSPDLNAYGTRKAMSPPYRCLSAPNPGGLRRIADGCA